MIVVRPITYLVNEQGTEIEIRLVSVETIKEFLNLLNRSLNCAPEFGKDWFELADRLESFLKQI